MTTATQPKFLVTWQDPAEATYFWTLNRMHMPEPMTAADGAFLCSQADGLTAAARTYGVPMRALFRRINTYLYVAFVPVVEPSDCAEAQTKPEGTRMTAAMAGLHELWHDEWLPEVQRYLACWERYDLRGASLPRLVEHFDVSLDRTKRLSELHFLIWFPMGTAIS